MVASATMRVRKPDTTISLEDLKKLIRKHKEQGRNLIGEMRSLLSHAEKMQEYYSEWEDRLNQIQNSINELSTEHDVIDVDDYDMVGEVLGERNE